MKPLLRRFPPDDAFPELDARLRAEANAARREPPPALRPRILAAVRARQEARTNRRRVWHHRLAAAAVVLVFGLWIASRPRGAGPQEQGGAIVGRQDIVRPLRRLLHPETPRVVAEADRPLVAEARALWSDTSNVARGIVGRLPMALRLGSSPGSSRGAGGAVPVSSEAERR